MARESKKQASDRLNRAKMFLCSVQGLVNFVDRRLCKLSKGTLAAFKDAHANALDDILDEQESREIKAKGSR